MYVFRTLLNFTLRNQPARYVRRPSRPLHNTGVPLTKPTISGTAIPGWRDQARFGHHKFPSQDVVTALLGTCNQQHEGNTELRSSLRIARQTNRSHVASLLRFWGTLSITVVSVVVCSDAGFAVQDQRSLRSASGSARSKDNLPMTGIARLSTEGVITNTKSSVELRWSFGGRVQQGWTLYSPLISAVVGSESDIDSDGFIHAVAQWQTARGLSPTGIVDEQTWSTMIAEFQKARIGKTQNTSTDSLVVIPGSEFYDPERPEELRRVDSAAYAAYRRLLAAAARDTTLNLKTTPSGELDSDERFLKIISAFRSRDYQARLRRSAPRAGRAALAVNSPHFTGRALDLYVGGEPVSTADTNRRVQTSTPIYKWLVKNAGRFGFRPYFYEPWHWEYVR